MGGFAWTGFDYRGEPTPFGWPNINSHFGIMDMCGFPKNVYYYYKSWWTAGDFIHLSPHWNWKGKEGQVIKVWVNTSCKDVELFLNGKSLGKRRCRGTATFIGSYPIRRVPLKAVGHLNGRKIESEMATTGPAAKIVLTPFQTTIKGDGYDGTAVNVTVVDAQGREVPDAQDLIHFALNGNAKIIGVGNGDPSSHEDDHGNQRHLFNGKCQVIIQGGASGAIQLSANADGLQSSTTEIKAE